MSPFLGRSWPLSLPVIQKTWSRKQPHLRILLFAAVALLLAACSEADPGPDPTPLPPDDGTPAEVQPVEAAEPLDYAPWYDAGDLSQEHFLGTLTPLADGRVLMLGGMEDFAVSRNTADLAGVVEIYDPESREWDQPVEMLFPRFGHTATQLDNELVLVAGGRLDASDSAATDIVTLFEPGSGDWIGETDPLNEPRAGQTATLLLGDGKVLVAGGDDESGELASAELYDPANEEWSTTGSLNTPRKNHTATFLGNGKVLVVGGSTNLGNIDLASAELYDPSTGLWTPTGSMSTARQLHTATLLPDGKVLVAGGYQDGLPLAGSELYDPLTGLWSTTGSLGFARLGHTATLLPDGLVLVVGGDPPEDVDCELCDEHPLPAWTEVYDPEMGEWGKESRLAIAGHGAALLPDGQVLVAGGRRVIDEYHVGSLLFPGVSGVWDGGAPVESAAAAMPAGVEQTTATSMGAGRVYHSATLLTGGQLLVAGGADGPDALKSAELYDLIMQQWSATGAMDAARYLHSATRLPNGKVLVAGGDGAAGRLASAELYDPAAGTFTPTGSMAVARTAHHATLLPNGKVLVSGGLGTGGVYLDSAELYDPAAGTFTPTGSMSEGRFFDSVTLLDNGRVLAAGGYGFNGVDEIILDSAELYNPASGTWTPTGSMGDGRAEHSATLLDDGMVLIAGGDGGASALDSAELYDSDGGDFSPAGSLMEMRTAHTATALPNGLVLIVGGANNIDYLNTAELYDPIMDMWESADGLQEPGRLGHTATVLTTYQVMVTGGESLLSDDALDYVEIYHTDMQNYHLEYGDLLEQTPAKPRLVGRYNDFAGELVVMMAYNFGLWKESADLTSLWAVNMGARINFLAQKNGVLVEPVITQEQMDALESFIDHVGDEASPELQQAMKEEGSLLPPYEEFVGLTVSEARQKLFDGVSTAYTITPTAGSNGKITPAGQQTLQAFDGMTFQMLPNAGHKVKEVLVDGVSKGAVTSYTFEKVSANHTIAVSFEEGAGNLLYLPITVGN